MSEEEEEEEEAGDVGVKDRGGIDLGRHVLISGCARDYVPAARELDVFAPEQNGEGIDGGCGVVVGRNSCNSSVGRRGESHAAAREGDVFSGREGKVDVVEIVCRACKVRQ